MVQINLNDYIKVKLTDYGKNIYYHQYDELNKFIIEQGREPISPKMPKIDIDGKTEMLLWEFMQIYGNYISMGSPNVIKPVILEIKRLGDSRDALFEAIRNGTPLPPHGRLIDADELLKRIDKVAKKPSLSIDTINGLCGAVAIIYDMLIETGQEEGESE